MAKKFHRSHNTIQKICLAQGIGKKANAPVYTERAQAVKQANLMASAQSAIGESFGRLTITEVLPSRKPHEGLLASCSCSCGNSHKAPLKQLKRGNTRSCGCLRADQARLNHKAHEGPKAYFKNPEYANRASFLYLVEVEGQIDKIGIAFDIKDRSRGSYSEIWWQKEMTRAQCFAVEQVALRLTEHFRPSKPVQSKAAGLSEQRFGWVIEDVILLLEDLSGRCLLIGWEKFLAEYLSTAEPVAA